MRAFCPICADLFDEDSLMVAPPCGHVFHENCLLKWLIESRTCPDCRIRVTQEKIIKLYFSSVQKCGSFNVESATVENEINCLKVKLKEKDMELKKCQNEKNQLVLYCEKAENQVSKLEQEKYENESEIKHLKLKVKSLSKLEVKVQKLAQRNAALSNDLEHLDHVRTIVSASQQDVENLMNSYGDGPGAVQQISIFCSVLKRELRQVSEAKAQLQNEIASLKKDYGLVNQQLKNVLRHKKTRDSSLAKEIKKVLSPKRSITMPSTPRVGDRGSKQASYRRSSSSLTPISVPVGDKKRKMDVVVLNKEVATSSRPVKHATSLVAANCVKCSKPKDEDSVIQTGYNGLGGHGRILIRASYLKLKKRRQ
ncbi:E3 ubiquitin-protein ligase TRAIP-like [Stegodyphus dumicola]|uniref:E3 ubiquitin-protein ligase TRAIP-like n=1 Tax=Stegodyphus dumicola TaxID=202533 RepID=UPI0015ABE245|nr:E3 ubiquitin-protein ligase TRAIP-like [Stegodyphus dumicola]